MKVQLKLALFSFILLYITINHTMTVKASQTVNNQNIATVQTTASQNRQIVMISVVSAPARQTYSRGEELDLAGLVVQGYYDDGSSAVITDYQIMGYDSSKIGSQTVIVLYQNKMDVFTVNVLPEKVKNITYTDNGSSFSLSWEAVSNAGRYDIYCLNETTGEYVLKSSAYTNSISLSKQPGEILSIRIKAIVNIMGVEYQSDFSDTFVTASAPAAVADLSVTATTADSISLSWTAVDGATGYMVYRSLASKNDFKLIHTGSELTFTDTGLLSATGYKYKVCAYVYSEDYAGAFSPVIDVSTNPSKPVLKYKAGEGKVRLTWSAVTGASSYEIYIGSANSDFRLLVTVSGGNGGTYIAENLTTGDTYQFYIIARRKYNGAYYDSQKSDIKSIFIGEIEPTSTTAKLYPTEKDFYNSWAYQKLTNFFSKYVNYSRSYVIPGLITTNVGGFASTRMCPQGLTFAGDYLLMSAYDLSGEENTVIYVMDKSSKELLTTVILLGKAHAGGLAFDGSNVWVTIGAKVAAIPFADIKDAAESNEPYVYVYYSKIITTLSYTASFTTYYDDMLWIGTYNELESTYMYSYTIEDKDTDPKLTKKNSILMPNRVQGVAFTDKGTLIISRSCQIHSGMRGYLRQLDVYKPDFSKPVNGVIPLGDLVNSVSVPSMNEGIAINGNYLYVTYETGAFDESVYRMDRITAFKLTDVTKKKSK